MANNFFYKINKKRVLLLFIFPVLLLLGCIKANIGNFDSLEQIKTLERKTIYEYSGSPFEFSRTRSIFSTTVSLAEKFVFFLSPEQVMFARGDIGKSNELYFSWAPPGTAIVGSFFFKLFSLINLGQFGAYLSIIFVSLCIHNLIFTIVYNYITKKDEYTAFLSSYLYTFSTIAFVYSITYFQHQYTVFFLLLMLLGIFKTIHKEKNYVFFSYIIPLIYGLSAFFDYPNLVILLPSLIVYILVSDLNLNIFRRTCIFILLPISVLLFFHQTQFDNPLQTTNTLVSGFITKVNETALQQQKNDIANIFSIQKVYEGIRGYFFTTERGIFFYSPIMILGLIYLVNIYKKRIRLALFFTINMLTTILLYASFSSPLGGWCFGPRYLLPVYLFLSICTALWIKQSTKLLKMSILPLLFISIANNLSGALSTLTIPENQETFFAGIKNFDFILNGVTGSLFYKISSPLISLVSYFVILLTIITIIFLHLIFYKKEKISL